jgi:hypothetical protein
MTPARRAALLRLLADWEAGRMTTSEALFPCLKNYPQFLIFEASGFLAHVIVDHEPQFCLTPPGLAAARAIKETDNG